MTTFEIKDDFYLDGKPFKIISGALHYFRVVPEYWQDRLEKLRLLGCNTVETYVPWNLHEKEEGQFDFSGQLDLRKFIQMAEKLGLYVILRPSPYICAEWEFGGFPYWLLKDKNIKLRFNEPRYLAKVEPYMHRLLSEVKDLQVTENGPIIMMQVENEYGSYANDKTYLRRLAEIMRESGIDVPFVTSDGTWEDMLQNGTVPDVALPTVNCGSEVKKHFSILKEFNGEKKPLMVMEFWLGWFDAWGDEKHHTTDIESAAKEVADCLEEGSINFYMYHGGTNFGFMNGSNFYDKLTPDVTSYDYDALVSEWGDITPKYKAFQKVISQYTEIPDFPLSMDIKKKAYGKAEVKEKVSLFETLNTLANPVHSSYPMTMEALNQGYGYVYYTTDLGKKRSIGEFRFTGCNDRAQVFVNKKHQFTQFDQEIGKTEKFELTAEENELGILVENMGRVNYSEHINHQEKGISKEVIVNHGALSQWQMYSLPMNNLEKVDFSKDWRKEDPGFYHFEFQVDEIGDTFLDMEGWGKGFVVVNGHNIGRYWEKGPQKRLYIPGPYLRKGTNEVVLFESEGKNQQTITFTDVPNLG